MFTTVNFKSYLILDRTIQGKFYQNIDKRSRTSNGSRKNRQEGQGNFPEKIHHNQRTVVCDNFEPVYGHRQCLL